MAADYQKYEMRGAQGFRVSFETAIENLKELGFGQSEDEPIIGILFLATGKFIGEGDDKRKEVDAIVFVGATQEEIAKDLLSSVPQK